jgi:hypothetical protein
MWYIELVLPYTVLQTGDSIYAKSIIHKGIGGNKHRQNFFKHFNLFCCSETKIAKIL